MAKLVTMYISMYSVSHDVYYWSSNIIMFYVWIMDIDSIFHLQCGRVMTRSISLTNLLTVGTLWFS